MNSKYNTFFRLSLHPFYSLLSSVVLCGGVVFHGFGNAVRGWIDTPSMFYWWMSQWFNPNCEAEHGPFILGAAIWLFIRGLKYRSRNNQEPEAKRQKPESLQAESGCSGHATGGKPKAAMVVGVVFISLALALHAFGYVVQHTRLSIVAFLLYVIGAAYVLGGERAGRASVFPCVLMLFTIPFQVLFDLFSYPIRLAVIDMAHLLSQGFGFAVLRDGTMLYAANDQYIYDVAPVCSGLRSLMAILALVLIVGHFTYHRVWPQILLFGSAFFFAYCGNVVRLFSIIAAAEWFGQDAGTLVHDYGGFVVFVTVLLLALGSVTVSTRYFPYLQLPVSKGHALPALAAPLFSRRAAWSVVVLVGLFSLATVWGIRQVDRLSISNACGILLQEDGVHPVLLPEILNFEWMGKRVAVTEQESASLPDDTGFSRAIYRNFRDEYVFVSVVLSGKDRSSIHRPEICLDAQGWEIVSRRRHELAVPRVTGHGLEVTLLEIQRRGRDGELVRSLFAYWFIGDGVSIAHHWDRVVTGFVDRVLHFKRTRWAYVFAQTRVLGDQEGSLDNIEAVIELVIPNLYEGSQHSVVGMQ